TCEACADDGKKFKCTQSIKDGYQLDSGKCVKKETAQTCENMGYKTGSCGSCERAYKTGYTDADGVACYRCEAYDCSKTCSQLNSSWVAESTGCRCTKTGWHSTMDVVMDDAYEIITGSDGDCNICGEERNIYTITPKNSDCYDIVSITGAEVTKVGNKYQVPYGAEFTVTTKKNANTSRLCMRANDSLSVNGETGFVLEDHSSTFTLNEAFLDDVKVSKNNNASFAVAAMEEKEKITYTILINVEHTDKEIYTSYYDPDEFYIATFFSIYVQMPNASGDEFMKDAQFYVNLELYNGYDTFGPNPPQGYYEFDGKYYTYVKDNGDDDSGMRREAHITNNSLYKLYYQGKEVKLTAGCTQLGTAEDNTEVCIEIDNG
ncbi:MAG: hypothetical protein Q4D80_06785, partial [Pseudomonadota bacterium]|nr:hypothetical protein [Pseudomonadota bacterium]